MCEPEGLQNSSWCLHSARIIVPVLATIDNDQRWRKHGDLGTPKR